jgi:hypothetical protein
VQAIRIKKPLPFGGEKGKKREQGLQQLYDYRHSMAKSLLWKPRIFWCTNGLTAQIGPHDSRYFPGAHQIDIGSN